VAYDRYADADRKKKLTFNLLLFLSQGSTYYKKYVTKKNCVPSVVIPETKIIAEYIFVLIRISFVTLTHF